MIDGVKADHGLVDLPDLGADARLLAEAAMAAGAIALRFFGNAPKTWVKAGNSPVSEADIAADQWLQSRLMAARPSYGWLSEETADTDARLGAGRVFVIDPIDGTRAFIAGRPDWSISTAIVEAGRPIAAALLQPVLGTLLVASAGRGAWHGAQRLSAGARTSLSGARLSGPRRFFGGEAEALSRGAEIAPTVGSLALRIAHVATHEVDGAFADGNAHDWDVAAADLIVAESGGQLSGPDGAPLAYNAPVPRHPALVAAGPGLLTECRALLDRLLAGPGRARPQ